MTMPEREWLELKRRGDASEPLARLRAELDNHTRNAAGWRRQVERLRRAGTDPGDLLDAIAEAEADARRVAEEIARLLDLGHAERDRAARREYSDQGRRIGQAIGGDKP